MKKISLLLGGLALGAVVALTPSTGTAGIVGGPHDFSPSGEFASVTNGLARFKWGGETNYYNNPCQVCHIPHKSQFYSAAKAPLWNHKLSANTYVTYDQAGSATFNALGLSVSLGSSVACLSCHDGSVAINQTANGTGSTATNSLNGAAVFAPSWAIEAIGGTDLTRMHPIGVSYSAAAAVDTELKPVAGILAKMVKGTSQNVECGSCHDIHQTLGASATVSHDLIVDLEGGQLCLTCHNK